MDLLTRVERAIEGVFEGLFSHRFRGRVQPLEVARRLTRAMEDQKMVSVSQVFVPNEFVVSLHPEDLQSVAPFESAIMPELTRHVEQTASEQGYGLLGRVAICFKEDPSVAPGDIRVTGQFVRREEQGKQVADAPTSALKATDRPVLQSARQAFLRVGTGPDEGGEFYLSAVHTTIGRGSSSDISVTDTSVSRAHAEIEARHEGYYARDLGSKNGTLVNGAHADDVLLQDGDTIAIGATLFQFHSTRVV